MRAYTIALALFTFGFVIGSINGLGLFDVVLPTSGMDLQESEVMELAQGATSGGASPLYSIASVLVLGQVFFSGLATALTIIPLFSSYGIDPIITMMIQGPIWFVYAAAAVQFFTGRSLKNLE